MGKIGSAQIDTIHLANDVVTGKATASGHNGVATAANPEALPVQIAAAGTAHYSDVVSGGNGTFNITVRRIRGNVVLASDGFTINGNRTESRSINFGILDAAAQAGDQYRIEVTATSSAFPPSIVSWSGVTITVLWTKL